MVEAMRQCKDQAGCGQASAAACTAPAAHHVLLPALLVGFGEDHEADGLGVDAELVPLQVAGCRYHAVEQLLDEGLSLANLGRTAAHLMRTVTLAQGWRCICEGAIASTVLGREPELGTPEMTQAHLHALPASVAQQKRGMSMTTLPANA